MAARIEQGEVIRSNLAGIRHLQMSRLAQGDHSIETFARIIHYNRLDQIESTRGTYGKSAR
jgi:hypothetical protein